MHWRRDKLGDAQRIPLTRADHIGHAARMRRGGQGVSKVYWTKDNVTGPSALPQRTTESSEQHKDMNELPEQTLPSFTFRHPVSLSSTPSRGDVTLLYRTSSTKPQHTRSDTDFILMALDSSLAANYKRRCFYAATMHWQSPYL